MTLVCVAWSQWRHLSVGNLPPDVKTSELSRVFSTFGIVESIVLGGEMVSAPNHCHDGKESKC